MVGTGPRDERTPAASSAGTATFNVTNISAGALNEQPVVQFTVIKGSHHDGAEASETGLLGHAWPSAGDHQLAHRCSAPEIPVRCDCCSLRNSRPPPHL
jgi:hypothetical protein